jgi:hypothetical protein
MSGPTPAPMYRIRVEAHQLDRWQVAALAIKVPAVSEVHAREFGVREAHRLAQVPPMWPLIRRSLRFARAEAIGSQAVTPLNPRTRIEGQLELDLQIAA